MMDGQSEEIEVSPLQEYLQQIAATFNAGLPYPALMLALAVPDICANLELPPAAKPDKQKRRYLKWFEKYLAHRIEWFTADDCWNMRCGIVHQGKFHNGKSPYETVFFTLSEGQGTHGESAIVDADGNIISKEGPGIAISLPVTLRAIFQAADEWEKSQPMSSVVHENMKNLVRWYPDGFPSRLPGLTYATGAPCIG